MSTWIVITGSQCLNCVPLLQGEGYRCTVSPECNYVASKLIHLKNHEKAHKGEKSFEWSVHAYPLTVVIKPVLDPNGASQSFSILGQNIF